MLFKKNSPLTNSKAYTPPKQIAPYLYEMSFSDYTADIENITTNAMEAFGCSSVRNGNFYGRNFDYIFNDSPEFVIHVTGTENRHASLGVATHFGLRESSMLKGEYDKQLELIPNFTLDGINDAGVIASINVVPGKEDVPELTEHAAGVERYQILKENYAEGNSMVGMRNLMARVKYSNAYNYSNNPAWYSEVIPQSVLKEQDSEKFAEYAKGFENIAKDYWDYITNDVRNPANTKFWHTTHNSIYDIENRILRLTVQENYSDYFDFSLE